MIRGSFFRLPASAEATIATRTAASAERTKARPRIPRGRRETSGAAAESGARGRTCFCRGEPPRTVPVPPVVFSCPRLPAVLAPWSSAERGAGPRDRRGLLVSTRAAFDVPRIAALGGRESSVLSGCSCARRSWASGRATFSPPSLAGAVLVSDPNTGDRAGAAGADADCPGGAEDGAG